MSERMAKEVARQQGKEPLPTVPDPEHATVEDHLKVQQGEAIYEDEKNDNEGTNE